MMQVITMVVFGTIIGITTGLIVNRLIGADNRSLPQCVFAATLTIMIVDSILKN